MINEIESYYWNRDSIADLRLYQTKILRAETRLRLRLDMGVKAT